MASHKVLIIGWYGKGNVGDDAFIKSFRTVWPEWDITFSDRFPCAEEIRSFDALIVGGGSLLSAPLPNLPESIDIPYAFISVDDQRPSLAYESLLNGAKLIVSRSPETKHIFMPDIVFALPEEGLPTEKKRDLSDKRIVVMMNDFLPARGSDAKYKEAAFNWAQHELAGTLDMLIESGFSLDFVPMCFGQYDDRRTAGSLISLMRHDSKVAWDLHRAHETHAREAISRADMIISMRYHGCVFAAQQGVPFVALSTHDKFVALCQFLRFPGWVPYYGLQKTQVLSTVRLALLEGYTLKDKADEARNLWLDSSEQLENILFG